jgi:hypothetical protein
MLNDLSKHRFSIVHGETLLIHIYLEPSLIEQLQWNLNVIESASIDILFHERSCSPTLGRYFPLTLSGSLADEMYCFCIKSIQIGSSEKPSSTSVLLSDGSICVSTEVTVGDISYDKIEAVINVPSRLVDFFFFWYRFNSG